MAVTSVSGTGSTPVKIVDRADTGFGALSAESFLKLLIAELQNQDPTQPVGNEQLLNQLSTMRSLQANLELEDAMKSITSNQQLSTAASFLGQRVAGTDAKNVAVTGVASRAFLRDGKAYVAVGDKEVPLANVTSVTSS